MNDNTAAKGRRPSGEPPIVLIVASTITFLTELSLFGRLVQDRTTAKPVFYCPFPHWTADAFAKKCEDEGTTCLIDPLSQHLDRHFPPDGSSRKTAALRRGPIAKVKSRLARLASKLPAVGPAFVAEWLALSVREAELRELLDRVRPALIVMGGDMVGYDTALIIAVAHDYSIAVMIVPSTMSNGQEQAVVYYGDPNYHVTGMERELIALLFPKWVRRQNDKRLFRCPPGRILALEFYGLAPPAPWCCNSGSADVIAMESKAMIDYYVEAGMSRKPMVLTGTLSDDEMAKRVPTAQDSRVKLCHELGMDPARPTFLSALVPDFLYVNGGLPKCDFKEYRALVEFWIDSLASLKNCNRIVALHPSVDPEEMRWIERDGIRIGTGKTADMVPLCDVYVTSVSSTIRWAIGCGKPVVNYDVYRCRYTDFVGVPGVLVMEEQHEFRDALQRLANDQEYRRQLTEAQRSAASDWAMHDGCVGDRMIEVMARLSAVRQREREAVPPSERSKDLVS